MITAITFKPVLRNIKKRFRPTTLAVAIVVLGITLILDAIIIIAFLFWAFLQLN